ncbi:MAG: stage 0 sporulation family protein [Oscillospiraceae bacterium]
MTEIISVRFKTGGKQYYFDPQGQSVKAGEGVILETSRGLEYGECVKGNHMVDDEAVVQPLRVMVRVATDKDKETVAQNREKEKSAFKICQKKIADHGLDMKLVDAEYSFEGNKILFFFTSEGRVDFRALVKDLAATLHARIELRQIGVRDEAKMLGGLGICGKPFCCSQFLDEFQPVSIKMAKTQNLSLNPAKISGTCGRLMCCLKYEQNAYEDAVKRCPKQESFVETPDGVGTVTNVNLLREQVKVSLEDSNDPPKCYSACEICVVRSGKGKRPEGYVAPPPEELAKLRKATPEEEITPRLGERSPLSAALEEILTASETRTETPAQKPQESSRSNRRRNRNRSGGKSQQEAAQEKQPQEKAGQNTKPKHTQKPKQEQTQKKEAAPTAEGGAKKNNSNRRRPRRRRPKAKPEGGAPKTES